ncbi:MAG TPA: PLDc N-terminal domain-containing protein [Wenzhouxiangellaceae bacterium]|nr:PLDc N-terminal domain-containing protein [Wenzhouxiangellaceae bacterium]
MGPEIGLLGLIWLVILVWAIIKTAQARVGVFVRFVWIVVLILFPVVGFLFWIFLGPKG